MALCQLALSFSGARGMNDRIREILKHHTQIRSARSELFLLRNDSWSALIFFAIISRDIGVLFLDLFHQLQHMLRYL